jgi:hypothetical protein
MFFFPIAEIHILAGETFDFFIYGISANGIDANAVMTNWTSISIIAIIILNALITITAYKHRLIQVRLSILNLFVMAGSIFLLWYNVSSQADLVKGDIQYLIPMIIPIICIIITFLAIRAIGKDESLIKSMDRIR